MKSGIILLLVFIAGLLACRQELRGKAVPPQVQHAFQANFPQAQAAEWRQTSRHRFEGEFKQGGLLHKVQLDEKGSLLLHKAEVPATALPDLVQTALAKKKKGAQVETLEKVEHGDQVYYQAELRGLLSHLKLVFKADGLPEQQFTYWE